MEILKYRGGEDYECVGTGCSVKQGVRVELIKVTFEQRL